MHNLVSKSVAIVAVAALAARIGGSPAVAITARPTTDEVGHERGPAIVLAAEPVVLDDHVLSLVTGGASGLGFATAERLVASMVLITELSLDHLIKAARNRIAAAYRLGVELV